MIQNNNILLSPIQLGGGSTNIGLYWFPPIPIPSVAIVPCQGADKLKNTILLMIFHAVYEKHRRILINHF